MIKVKSLFRQSLLGIVCFLANQFGANLSTLASSSQSIKDNVLLAQNGADPILPSPLQGKVENSEILSEPMPKPVLPAAPQQSSLTGKRDEIDGKDILPGQAEEDKLDELSPKADVRPNALKGSASTYVGNLADSDPDSEDQELQVEWDRWRNRFLQAVLSGAMEGLNNPEEAYSRDGQTSQPHMQHYPVGTVAWFSCQITSDKKIDSLKLDESSGFPNFDRAVLNAVRSLENTSILRFPARSRRKVVSQAAGIKTSDHSQNQYFKFGDVEHYRVPAY